MSKSWKKILTTGASLLIMASVGAGVSNTKANASHYHFNNRYSNPFSRMLERKGWTSGPLSAFRHFRYNGHRFTLRTSSRAFQGEITSLDGNHHATNTQIVTALNGGNPYYHHYRKHARKHYRHFVKKAKKYVAKKHTHKTRKVTKKVTKRRVRKAPKRRAKRSKKVTAYKPTKNKTSRKVANFRKSAKYHSMWTNALKMNQRALRLDLRNAAKYSKDGNTKDANKANQEANNLKVFVKHDQTMLNLGK